ncbi:MAG: ankyrin repeat domain-containing protein [Gammaproteobacteria bacterium]|nr:ankyrin repeat domain-containing protein [Gammaproteobacteria bacterium]MBU1978447.1 ankyrin repeat domain-containing protein [Gammaproteobacteria bacterium]
MKSMHKSWASLLIVMASVAALASTAHAQQALGQNDQLIHDAARIGSGAEVAKIIKENPAMRDARTGLGSTPLHLAATNPDVSALKALLAAGANVNARDEGDNTPLHMAAYTNRIEHAKVLLEAGADVNIVSTGGRTPMAMARKSRADEIAGLIALWVLKGCKSGGKCEQASTYDLKRLVD